MQSAKEFWLLAIPLIGVVLAQTRPVSAQSGGLPTVRVAFVDAATTQPQVQNRAVIFYDDFDRATDLHTRYFEYNEERGGFVWDEKGGAGGQGGAMRCRFEKGQVEAGGLKFVFGKNPFGRGPRQEEAFREIYWRVYVRHEPGWEGNPAKLARATCMAGADWSQGFIAHVWGGKGDSLCVDPATGIRDSRKVTTRYNDFDHLRWLGLRNATTPLFHPSESGRWVCIESHVQLNTSGQKDGVFNLWIDGKLEASRTDLDWHGDWKDYGINAIFLENYWNSGSVKRQARWFDHFVISTKPIGPLVTTRVPAFTRTTGTNVTVWEAEAATDPDGKDIVWKSKTLPGAMTRLTINTMQGRFVGSRAGQTQFSPDTICWLRLRQKSAAGDWTEWTAWHAPFRTNSDR
jgi:hypothetical protein